MGTTTHAPTDRVTCPPDHKHGASQRCYVAHRCRCDDCKTLRAQLSRKRRRDEAYGRPTTTLIPADQVTRHINTLQEWGVGYRQVAELTGLGSKTVFRHMQGASQRIDPSVAARILAIKPSFDHLAPGAHIPAIGVKRRLWALRKLGWHSGDVADLLGCDRSLVAMLLVKERTKVTVRWHRDISAAYDALSMRIPSETAVRKRVKLLAANHPGPLDWDDIDTDERPPQVRGVNRQLMSIREREARVVELHHLRLSDRSIAQSLGIADRTVIRIRQRLGLPGWTKEQQEAAA